MKKVFDSFYVFSKFSLSLILLLCVFFLIYLLYTNYQNEDEVSKSQIELENELRENINENFKFIKNISKELLETKTTLRFFPYPGSPLRIALGLFKDTFLPLNSAITYGAFTFIIVVACPLNLLFQSNFDHIAQQKQSYCPVWIHYHKLLSVCTSWKHHRASLACTH